MKMTVLDRINEAPFAVANAIKAVIGIALILGVLAVIDAVIETTSGVSSSVYMDGYFMQIIAQIIGGAGGVMIYFWCERH